MTASRASVANTYAGAAWLVVVGVLASWFFLKQDAGGREVDLPELPQIALLTETAAARSLLEDARAAFAAGRIVRPAGESALDLYKAHLQQFPDDEQAREGLMRVTRYLVGAAESALRQREFNAAREFAVEALKIDKGNRASRSVIARVNQHAEIERLSLVAMQQIEAGNLTRPKDANALSSYQAVLAMDPDNATARQGLNLIAQRLASLAQAEAIADRPDRARQLIATAKQIAPDAAGIEAAEKLTAEWKSMAQDAKDQSVKSDLVAAAEASKSGRLTSADVPGQLGALDFYRSALKQDPESAAAKAGLAYVIDALIERAAAQLAEEEVVQGERSIEQAVEAGATQAELAAVKAELEFLSKRARYRAGVFDDDDLVAVSELTIKRRVQPRINPGVNGGKVDLSFTVNEQGEVQNISVIDADSKALETAAMDALERWRFEPYAEQGRRLPVRTVIRMRIET